VFYGCGGRVIHVASHHVKAGTPDDPQTPRLGEGLIAFLVRASPANFGLAWRLQMRELHRRSKRFFSLSNELLVLYAISIALVIASLWLFGRLGLTFLVGQAFAAASLIETVNYVQHYGLMRERKSDGSYVRFGPQHSWNSAYRVSNALLLQSPRHADHHLHPTRRYPDLRWYPNSPELPAGYATMLLVAWIPPLWFSIMDKRIAPQPGES
jgi:alkane 1-monooxygenase